MVEELFTYKDRFGDSQKSPETKSGEIRWVI